MSCTHCLALLERNEHDIGRRLLPAPRRGAQPVFLRSSQFQPYLTMVPLIASAVQSREERRMRALCRLVVALTVTLSSAALAGERATPEEAKAMALRAVEYIKSAGSEVAYKAFTERAPGWVDRDLYVFVVRKDGLTVAHGGSPILVGKNLSDLKDVDGKSFILEFVAMKVPGWVEYKWRNPQSQAVELKTSYVVPLNDTVIGVGAYKQ
jgi:cytochrome c